MIEMTRFNLFDSHINASKNLKRFEEKFPNDVVLESGNYRRKSSPPLFHTLHHGRLWDDPLPKVREESTYELNAEEKLNQKKERRHSWSIGMENNKTFHLPLRKISRDSSFSNSTSSIPEAIEECSSDEEVIEELEESNDYMNCINCNRNSSFHDKQSKKMNYCYNCRQNISKLDLVHTPQFINDKNLTSWFVRNSPQRSSPTGNMMQIRKKRLSNSCDLPVISELSINEDKSVIIDNANISNDTNMSYRKHRKLGMSISDGEAEKKVYIS